MDILYFGTACSEEFERKVLKITKASYVVAQNNFERALLDGFIKNGVQSITANCLPSMNYQVLGNRLLLKSERNNINEYVKTKTYPVLKIPVLKYMVYFLVTFIRILKWYLTHKDKEKYIISAVTFTPVGLAIKLLSKVLSYKSVGIICDLTEDLYKNNMNNFSTIKKMIMPIYYKIIRYVETGFDFYVFLTKYMNVVNTKNKPYIVVEGIYNNNLNYQDNIKKYKNNKKILLYSGSLLKIYGIEKIINVFNQINDINYELHIYGDGECKEEVIAAKNKNANIHYCGFITRDELFKKLQEATLLINLRDPKYSYTKYSFPSKMFEYMASGTPLLTTKLLGIPEDYYDYLYLVDSYKDFEIKNKIIEICNKKSSNIDNFGKNARNFIIQEKVAEKQVKKIIDLLSNK